MQVMWNAANLFEHITREGPGLGVTTSAPPTLDFSVLKERRDAYVARLNGIYQNNVANAKIEHVKGWASLLPGNIVEVKPSDGSPAVR
jgi:glutathione reductase (NADPH)